MKVNWYKEKERLSELISDGIPYLQIGKMYGVSFNAVKKAAKKLGIELKQRRVINEKEHFNKGKKFIKKRCLNCGSYITNGYYGKKFCSLNCCNEYRYKEKIKEWKDNPDSFKNEYISNYIKRYFFEKNKCKCEKCGWGEVNEYTGKIPLELHHIDGDCTNNKENNLQLLCPNCHSLTETYGSLNKISKRYKLKEYKTNISSKRIINLIYSINNEEKRNEILNLLSDKSNPDKQVILDLPNREISTIVL